MGFSLVPAGHGGAEQLSPVLKTDGWVCSNSPLGGQCHFQPCAAKMQVVQRNRPGKSPARRPGRLGEPLPQRLRRGDAQVGGV